MDTKGVVPLVELDAEVAFDPPCLLLLLPVCESWLWSSLATEGLTLVSEFKIGCAMKAV